MIKRIRVIGIGMGLPSHLTREAVAALAGVDVFLVADDGDKADLLAAGRAICAEVIPPDHPYRFVYVAEPAGPTRVEGHGGADQRMPDWSSSQVLAYLDALTALEEHEETVGLLVWGDPALYDSSIAIAESLRRRLGGDVVVEVIPGISALQLLAARHGMPLDGRPIHVTTGRGLVDRYDPELGDVVVLLDDRLRCLELVERYPDLELYWGADLGGPAEALVSGRLADVADEVRSARAGVRSRRGWVIDLYLLRAPVAVEVTVVPLPVWPPVAELSDGVVTLRPMSAEDWPVLLEDANNDESRRWAFSAERMSGATARRLAGASAGEWVRGPGAQFIMVDAATGRGAGTIKVMRVGPPDVGLIGYGVLPEHRGHGYTTRALRLLADWVFESTTINRLELGHKVDNVASGLAALRAGFVREAVHPGRLRNPDGTFSDEVRYGRVRGD